MQILSNRPLATVNFNTSPIEKRPTREVDSYHSTRFSGEPDFWTTDSLLEKEGDRLLKGLMQHFLNSSLDIQQSQGHQRNLGTYHLTQNDTKKRYWLKCFYAETSKEVDITSDRDSGWRLHMRLDGYNQVESLGYISTDGAFEPISTVRNKEILGLATQLLKQTFEKYDELLSAKVPVPPVKRLQGAELLQYLKDLPMLPV